MEAAVAADELSLRRGSGFAFSVSGVMLAEQTLLNAAVLTVDATSADHALAGVVFNVLLIARAPLQLFQAIQTSLLPHLTGLEVTEGHEAFARAIRVTVLAIAAFAGAVALGLLAIGPPVMQHLFGQHHAYNRFGLALIGLGMGMHLTSGALNQAVLARNQARTAAVCWLMAAAVFVLWMLLPSSRRRTAAHRDRLSRRCEPARADARNCLQTRCAERLSRRRRPRRSPGRPRPGQAGEDRRAGHEHARARLSALWVRWQGSMPPSTSTATPAPTIARTRSTFCGEWAMNGCPPQPGLTVMHSAMSSRLHDLGQRADRRGRVDRHADTGAALRIRSAV